MCPWVCPYPKQGGCHGCNGDWARHRRACAAILRLDMGFVILIAVRRVDLPAPKFYFDAVYLIGDRLAIEASVGLAEPFVIRLSAN